MNARGYRPLPQDRDIESRGFGGGRPDTGLGDIDEIANPPLTFQSADIDGIQGFAEQVTGGLAEVIGDAEGSEQVAPGPGRQHPQDRTAGPSGVEDLIGGETDGAVPSNHRQPPPSADRRFSDGLAHRRGGGRNFEVEGDPGRGERGPDSI